MTFTMINATGPIISAKISGEIAKSGVSEIQATALEAIPCCGQINALFILDNFRGSKREDELGDITFLTEHDKEIAKIAVVGEEEWRDFIDAFLAQGFRGAEVEYLLPANLASARARLEGDDPK